MKTLNLKEVMNLGGHRRSVNDIATLSEGIYQLGNLIGQMIDEDNNQIINITDDWLYANGKIWRRLATPAAASGVLYGIFEEQPLYPAVSYQSGGQFQVHVERVVRYEWRTSAPAGVAFTDYFNTAVVSTYNPYLTRVEVDSNKTRLDGIEGAWVDISNLLPSLLSGTNAGDYDIASSFYRYKLIGKTLFVSIHLVYNSNSAPQVLDITYPQNFQGKYALNGKVKFYDTYWDDSSGNIGTSAAFLKDTIIQIDRRSPSVLTSNGTLSLQTFVEIA